LLVQPVAHGDLPVGRDLREADNAESSYLNLKDWRATARRLEREVSSNSDESSSPLNAAIGEWENIATFADQVLREDSKDLEISSWYCEALVRLSGFEGLSSGFELLARLVENYWDEGLYPQEDEDGLDTRLAPLAGLIGRGVASSLVQPIKLLPLSDRADLNSVALWKIELLYAPSRSASSEDAERKSAEIASTLQAVKSSSPEFLRWTRRSVAQCQENLTRLMSAVDSKTRIGSFASQVTTPLEAIAKLLDDNVGHLFVEASASETAGDDEGAPEVVAPRGDGAAQRPNGREDALRSLERAAEYFEKAEPQAMIADSIRDVVRRARLPMMDLLIELLPDNGQRAEFLLRAGIKVSNG